MNEEELLEIIKLQDKELALLTGALQCMTGDAPCVKMIQDAMEIKAKIDEVKTIKAMEQEYGGSYAKGYNSYDGSYDGSYNPYNSYDGSYRGGDGMSNAGRRGRDGDNDGRYSERRGRDAMGRYMSRDDGYSRSPETDQLRKEMEEMRKKLDHMQ